jgi:hypothetical protein
MPELVPQSTPPPADEPPAPFPWEDHAAFRSSFLLHFTEDGHRAALEKIGQMLYDMALEAKGWPEWEESPTRAELRAIAEDLHHAQGFLWTVAEEQRNVSLDPEDARLAVMAAEWSRMVGRIAHVIENMLGPVWRGTR